MNLEFAWISEIVSRASTVFPLHKIPIRSGNSLGHSSTWIVLLRDNRRNNFIFYSTTGNSLPMWLENWPSKCISIHIQDSRCIVLHIFSHIQFIVFSSSKRKTVFGTSYRDAKLLVTVTMSHWHQSRFDPFASLRRSYYPHFHQWISNFSWFSDYDCIDQTQRSSWFDNTMSHHHLAEHDVHIFSIFKSK